jgi:hypothetical protein
LKNLTIDKPGAFKILSNGLYSSGSSLSSEAGRSNYKRLKIHKWILIIGRLLALSAAVALMIYSLLWASDGLWDIATILFAAGMIFFIPFILFGRKIKSIKKAKKYSKSNKAIIGWHYSGY